MRLAIVDPAGVATAVVKKLFSATRWCACDLVQGTSWTELMEERYTAAVIVDPPGGFCASDGRADAHEAVRRARDSRLPVLILTDRPAAFADLQGCHACVPPDSPIERVRGALLGLAASRLALRQIEQERANMQRLTDGVQHHIESLDAELRLASRVQQHFLPQGVQRLGPASFSTLYRPCSWVSGDLFDIFRLGERHVGFYVADVVGHGVAAGLVTMYVKHVISSLRVTQGSDQEIVPPSTVLAGLNDQLAGEVLEESQFITLWYGLLDLESLELRYSAAGHPPPLWLDADGGLRELHGDGGLLGLDRGQSFQDQGAQLRSGDRVFLYSDGLESVLISERHPRPRLPTLQPGIMQILDRTVADLLAALEQRLNNAPGSLNKADDVSVVVMDVTGAAGG